MLLTTLLKELDYSIEGDTGFEITGIAYNSSKVIPGAAFVCLCGAAADGHDYVQKACEAGAAVIIAQHKVTPVPVPVVYVEDTRLALALMSASWFSHPARLLKMVGITGTKGKTTTAYMLRSILEASGCKTGIIGTIGVTIGDKVYRTENTTPESYEIQKALRQMVDAGCGAAVMEASSIGLRDRRVAGIQFDVGVFTNFSEDHIGGSEHKDMAEYLACKSILFRQCRVGAANADDPHWGQITAGCDSVKTFGFSDQHDFQASNEQLVSRPGCLGVSFDLCGGYTLKSVEAPIPGRFSVYNALAASAAAKALGVAAEAVREGLRAVRVKGRVEPVPVTGEYTLLIDYAHNAVSMESVLGTLREYQPARLVCMFGAGGNRPKARRSDMGRVCGKMADLSVITSDNPRFEEPLAIIEDIKAGIHETSGKYEVIPDRREAIRWCMDHAGPGDIVVLAGKGHEDYQEIEGKKYHMDEREIVEEILKEKEMPVC